MSTRGYWWVWMMDGSHTSLCRPADVKDCVKTTGLLYKSKLFRKRKRKSRRKWWISSRFDKVWFIRVIKDIMSATSSNSGNTTGLFWCSMWSIFHVSVDVMALNPGQGWRIMNSRVNELVDITFRASTVATRGERISPQSQRNLNI